MIFCVYTKVMKECEKLGAWFLKKISINQRGNIGNVISSV